MKRIILALITIALVASVPFTMEAKKKTTRKKAKTENLSGLTALERKVVGKHMLSLQWISWESFGSVEIKKEADGTFSCRGEQLARKDGTIEIVDADHLVFTGEIRTKVYHINNGQEVLRSGTYNFVTKENRKYWRMQEISNPADNCADYIDIYFKR